MQGWRAREAGSGRQASVLLSNKRDCGKFTSSTALVVRCLRGSNSATLRIGLVNHLELQSGVTLTTNARRAENTQEHREECLQADAILDQSDATE